MEFVDELWEHLGSVENLTEAIKLLLSILDIEQKYEYETVHNSNYLLILFTCL